jgi:penicillin-binding protein 2
VLARDRKVPALAVHYRYLESPTDALWLRRMARQRLETRERRQPDRVASEVQRLRMQIAQQRRLLMQICHLNSTQWDRRAAAIQRQVTRIARSVNRRHRATIDSSATDRQVADAVDADVTAPWLHRATQRALDALLPPDEQLAISHITVAEELDYHVMIEDVSLDVAAEVEMHPQRYPGARIVSRMRRFYPAGDTAAHVVGHLGPVEKHELDSTSDGGHNPAYHPLDLIGRMGVERQYERYLRGNRGVRVDLLSRNGAVNSSHWRPGPTVGTDMMLTLDPSLQRTAERLLDSALRRRPPAVDGEPQGGGAVVVLDVRRGEVLAAASAPRFDPNAFSTSSSHDRAVLLSDPNHSLFDRAAQMAIPAGSVFKVPAAIALLETGTTHADEAFYCQGYLHSPDRQRCLIFVRDGVGHGDTTLTDALARSCNVYFFHYATQAGAASLIDWSIRLGFGRRTGIDLPGEVAGQLPTPANIRSLEGHGWRKGDTQALAIGQGSLTVTPLQIVRLLAAVANGGTLVTPRVVRDIATVDRAPAELDELGDVPQLDFAPPVRIEGLSSSTLDVIRDGLKRVVADTQGTAHGTVYTESIMIAGKTGTAETGSTSGGLKREDHAWFVGYAPAEAPKVAFVVALEHAGSGTAAAGPVAKRLVMRMAELGYFKNSAARRRESVEVSRREVRAHAD